jgi:replication-associated recombination protein RarA
MFTPQALLQNQVKTFNDLILVPRLHKELKFFYDNPTEVPETMMFHGYPGIGKTSFAILFGRDKCSDFEHLAMNECVRKHGDLENMQLYRKRVTEFYDYGSPRLPYLMILDEWHDLTEKQQNIFKVKLETLDQKRVFICLNTDRNNPVTKVVSRAIRSRAHMIDFNIRQLELEDHIGEVKKRYDSLTEDEIRQWLPDMRRIHREHKIRMAMSRLEFLNTEVL